MASFDDVKKIIATMLIAGLALAPLIKGAVYIFAGFGAILSIYILYRSEKLMVIWQELSHDRLFQLTVCAFLLMVPSFFISPDLLKSVTTYLRTILSFITAIIIYKLLKGSSQTAEEDALKKPIQVMLSILSIILCWILILRYGLFGLDRVLLNVYAWLINENPEGWQGEGVAKGGVNLLALMIPMILSLTWYRSFNLRLIGCLLVSAIVIAFWTDNQASVNRTAILALALAILVAGWCWLSERMKFTRIVAVIPIMLGGLVAIWGYVLIDQVELSKQYGYECIAGDAGLKRCKIQPDLPQVIPLVDGHRQVLWAFSADHIREIPLLGHGIRSFNKGALGDAQEHMLNVSRDDPIGYNHYTLRTTHPHNWIIELALEVGVPAVLAIFLALALLCWRCVSWIFDHKRGGFFSLWSLLLYTIMSLSAHSIWNLVWLSIGVLATMVCFLQVEKENNLLNKE